MKSSSSIYPLLDVGNQRRGDERVESKMGSWRTVPASEDVEMSGYRFSGLGFKASGSPRSPALNEQETEEW